MPIPFLKGKNVTLTFLLAQDAPKSEKIDLQATSFSVKPNVTQINDPILGKDRDDLDSEINYFEIKIETMVRNAKIIASFIKHQDKKDLKVTMAESAVGIIIKPHDGTQEAFMCRNFVLDDWEFSISGRTDRFKVPVPGRCQYFGPLASF